MRWLLLLALTGCLVVPQTQETTRVLGRYTTPMKAGAAGPMRLQLTESYATVHVMATQLRRCYREVHQRYEHRKELSAAMVGDVGGMGGDPTGLAVAAVIVAPIAILSGVITAVAVAADSPQVDRYERTVGVTATDCPLDGANAAVDVVMPSGAALHAMTNRLGVVSVTIPAGEPAQGVVVVRIAGSQASIGYSLDGSAPLAPPSADPAPAVVFVEAAPRTLSPSEAHRAADDRAFAIVRDALRSCGESHALHGVVAATLAIDATGHVSSTPDRGGAPFASCVNDAISVARFSESHAQKLVFPIRI